MFVQFLKPTLVNDRSHSVGDRCEVVDKIGHRLLKAGAAVVAIDLADLEAGPPIITKTADAPPAPETTSLNPGSRRRLS